MTNLVTVEEACDLVTDGTHYTPKNVGTGMPFLTVKDVTDSELDFSNCSLISNHDYLVANEGNSAPQKGDVLFSKDGTVGKVHVVSTDKPFAVLSSLAILRPKQGLVDAAYLGQVLRSPKVLDQAQKRKTGSAIRRIILTDLKRVEFPLPPLAEQRRIADVLDRAEALRAKRRFALAQLDILTQSIFVDMFGDPATNPKGWKGCTVGDVTECIVPGRDKPKSFSGGVPWVTTDDLTHLDFTHNSSKGLGLSFSEISEVKARIIPAGSVIISCVGNLGITTIAGANMVINQQLHSFQCNDQVNNIYLMHCLAKKVAFMYAKASSTTLPYMNKSVCNSIPVQIPPIELQGTFASRVLAINGIKTRHRLFLDELDALFASLQHRAFRGEL